MPELWAKVDDVVESQRHEDAETGGSTSCDANVRAPSAFPTAAVAVAAAATTAAPSEVGAYLEAVKRSGEKPVRGVTFLGHILTMYSGELRHARDGAVCTDEDCVV